MKYRERPALTINRRSACNFVTQAFVKIQGYLILFINIYFVSSVLCLSPGHQGPANTFSKCRGGDEQCCNRLLSDANKPCYLVLMISNPSQR